MMKNAIKGIFLDTETNGLDWNKHQILEIAFILVDLATGKQIDRYASMIQLTKDEWDESDPTSLKFTGITFEDSLQGKTKEMVRRDILHFFHSHGLKRGKALFICQNPSFDRIFFSSLIDVPTQEACFFPYNWLDLASMFWARQIANGFSDDKIFLSKDSIAHFFHIPPEEKPHRALAGVMHLILCYEKLVGFPRA